MSGPGELTQVKGPKYLELHEAIQDTYKTLYQAQNLLALIQSGPSELEKCEGGVEEQEPSLQNVLDEDATTLRDINNQLRATLKMMEEALV